MNKDMIDQAIDILNEYCDREHGGVRSRAAAALGVSAESGIFGKWLKRERRPSMSKIAPVLEKLGAQIVIPQISGVKPFSKKEAVVGESLPVVPVLGEAGAGPDVELFTGDPENTIPVLPGYFRHNLWAVKVKGDSMEPLIRSGAYVGVVPLEEEFEEGGLYLVRFPHGGFVVKRVRVKMDGSLALHSENPHYPPDFLEYAGHEKVIVGKVLWVWQLC